MTPAKKAPLTEGFVESEMTDLDVLTDEATVAHTDSTSTSTHDEHESEDGMTHSYFDHDAPEEHVVDDRIIKIIASLEHDLKVLKQLLLTGQQFEPLNASGGYYAPGNQNEGVEGYFDGERMIANDGKTYQVPPNYASKSKLVEGDPLKLFISPDGKYIFKQLGPVERRTVPGTLRMEGSQYYVDSDEGKTYAILTACVTYYMALYAMQPGDRVMVLIPADQDSEWGVIDNILTT